MKRNVAVKKDLRSSLRRKGMSESERDERVEKWGIDG